LNLTKKEFDRYLAYITSADMKRILTSDSLNEISIVMSNVSMMYCRVTMSLAQIKNRIDEYFVLYTTPAEAREGMKIGQAKIMSEISANKEEEVTRREVEYLSDCLENIRIACNARLKVRGIEGRM
jgi:hypothetical protein